MEDGDSISFLFHGLVHHSRALQVQASQLVSSEHYWWVSLLVLVVLIFINGFFSAAEFSIVSLNNSKVRKMADEGDRTATKLLNLISNPGHFLATIQVGVTFAGFLSSAFASDRFARSLSLLLDPSGRAVWARNFSMVLITVLLSYFTLVFGELVPKRLALQNPEKMAAALVSVIHFFSIILKPFTAFLTWSTNFVLKLMGLDPNYRENAATEEEIRMMLDVSNENIPTTEREMINNIFEFNDKYVSEIMTHRTNVVSLSLDASYEECIEICCSEKFSRIPVYEEDIDDIVGILHIKDVLNFLAKNDASAFNLAELIRQPYVTPETKSIDALFREMQRDHVQLAVVIDEYGGTAGIVTIEDLLEEIVGNIQDEYDEEDTEISACGEGVFLVDGLASPDDVSKAIPDFSIPEEDEDDYDTIAGYVIHLLDRIPDEDEFPEVRDGLILFKVKEMDEKRISKLELKVLSLEEAAAMDETAENEEESGDSEVN